MARSSAERQLYWKEYHAANRERIRARKRAHYAANRERLLADVKESQAEHHDEKIERDKRYYKEHREEILKVKKQYREEHVSERNAWAAARRALLVGATIGNLAEVKEIYRKAREEKTIRCYLCGELIPMGKRHVDHIVPLSKNGAHRPSNLAVACEKCNLQKHDKMPGEIGLLV